MQIKNCTPPKPHIAERETIRRVKIIESIIPELSKYATSMLLTGDMAYGQDYSISEETGIDIQLTTTADMVSKMSSCKFFQKYAIARIHEGFNNGIFQAFSLNFMHKEVSVTCHFWDEKTYKEILLYKKESIIRLRPQTKKIYTDHAMSFDGDECIDEFSDYKEGKYSVGVLPIYKDQNKKIYISSPLSDILGNAIVLFDDCGLAELIVECRSLTEEKIETMDHKKGKTYSIFNALRDKERFAEDVKIMLI